jgi:hypothetical protein
MDAAFASILHQSAWKANKYVIHNSKKKFITHEKNNINNSCWPAIG